MPLFQIVLIALGVSADAFAVALARGTKIRDGLSRRALVLAVAFGVFQAGMPLIGWLLGNSLLGFITTIDHWIAFGLLAGVGVHMVIESLPERRAARGAVTSADDEDDDESDIHLGSVLLLAFATSIDALAVGFGFAATDINIWLAIAVIGLTTFLFTLIGVWFGHRSGQRFGKPATAIGGLILIGIGTSILVEHLAA
ncbi:manganese efflux pump MntP [Dietzia sp.]|uniref:manganese efflux pump MntP n=1 Tax=Dietzia sp. TaxID=1871616 RepID=UPI002FDA332D